MVEASSPIAVLTHLKFTSDNPDYVLSRIEDGWREQLGP